MKLTSSLLFSIPARLVATCFALGGGCLYAQTPLYWGPNSSGAPVGGAGTWDLFATEWANNPGGNYLAWPGSGADYRAVFGGVGGLITLNSAITAGGLKFDADGYLIDLSGGSGSITLHDSIGFTPRIDVTNAGQSATINGPLSGTDGIAIGGRGTLILTGANSINGSSGINIACATLKVMSASGSLDSSNTLWMGDGTGDNGAGGGGSFVLDNTGAVSATSQTLAAINPRAGDSVVQATRVAAQNLSLSFGSQSRSAGATLNYIVTGGTNGTQNKINVSGQATGFINQSTFFGGSDFAWKDSGGFIRAINYGVDSGAVTTAGTTSITGTHIRATGAVTAQATASFTTLKLSGASNFTLAGGATLTVGGILKTGNNSALLSGGTALRAANSAPRELIVRTDQSADSLTINSIINNATGGATALTKSGPGILTLGGANTYTGITYLNGGTLSVATFPTAAGIASPLGQSTTGGTGNPLQFSGGTLQYTGGSVTTTRKFNFLAGGGGIDISQAGTTLTLNSTINGANSLDVDALIKSGPGILSISGPGDNSGFSAVVNGGILQLAKASSNNPTDVHALSSLFVNNGGTAQLSGTGGDQIYDGTPVTVNTGGILDFNGTDEGLRALRGGGTITNNHATLNSTLDLGEWSFANDFNVFSGVISNGTSGRLMSLVKGGLGTQVLSGSSTYTGQTLVNNGRLLVDGSIASSSFTLVGNEATIGGSGTVGNLTIDNGGTLAPGTSAGLLTISGDLTLSFSSIFNVELGGATRGTQYDAINVSGAFHPDGDLNVSFINGFNPFPGEIFDLFDFATRTGTFNNVSLPTLSGGLSWNTTTLYSNGQIAVVPEPATACLLVAGLALTLPRRRRI